MSRRFDPSLFGLGLAVATAAVVLLARAPHRAFDFDEIATVAVVGDGSPAAVWSALADAADANPPTFYLLESLGTYLSADPHVAFRLAPIAGFLGIPIALFLLVSGRCGRAAGLAAALVPFVTPLFTFFALEARPYTVATCALAWAWLMWQRVEQRGRAVALGAFLAAATALHYYAVVALVPFALAELIRTVRLSHLRTRVWVALVVGCAPLAAFWPLLSQFNRQYGGAFWAHPQLINAYTEILGVHERWATPLVGWLLAAIVVVAMSARAVPERNTPPAMAFEDWAIAVGFIALPVLTYAAALTLGTAMVPRYTMSVVLGISVAIVDVAYQARGRRGPSWIALAVLLIVVVQQADISRFGRVSAGVVTDHGDVDRLRRLVGRSQTAGLPIAVSNGLRFLPMAYYARPTQDLPFVYLIDHAAAVATIGTDSPDRALSTLAPYLAMRLEDRSRFLAAHSRFLLFSENEFYDWLPLRLMADGYSMRLVARDIGGGTNHMLFLVEAPKPSATVPQ